MKALNGINLEIKKGEFVSIMGPSGSGKSTMLHIIGCLDTPTSGKVLINGKDVSKLSDDELAEIRNKEIGFVFQFYYL
ncbi:MAG: ATP-binding cassette domain-containing protein, partial [Candidatus Parvarchaeota archaeon]|nr:ATP-binding cassette domain-containing protein [Candidatus Jingweiarchaeum tengchongense]